MTEYTLSNPHPGFGIDPNIMDETGRTVYPKWIDGPDTDPKTGKLVRILVKDEKEEKEHLAANKKPDEPKNIESTNIKPKPNLNKGEWPK